MTLDFLTQQLTRSSCLIHLIGVAGSGMSGLAALLLSLGHRVRGCDRTHTVEVDRLCQLGLDFKTEHDLDLMNEADLVIYSSAIKPGHGAFERARALGKPLVRRAEALAALLAVKTGVIVCGTHGKTTTAAMAAHVLRCCGQHPSHYVGAEIPILGANARWDVEGRLFVAEGDESDGTLIQYTPAYSLVLNIEADHLDFYQNLSEIKAVYHQLVQKTRDRVIYCTDDPGAREVCADFSHAVSYGQGESAIYRLTDLQVAHFQSHFWVWKEQKCLGEIDLNVPGIHNASNALAVIALGLEVGVDFAEIALALTSFRGARRRFEVKYQSPRNLLIDDYGHHPTEITATLTTARTCGRKRTVVLFQPHRYSRTEAMKEAFAVALAHADQVIVTEVYAANEDPIPGISGKTLVQLLTDAGYAQAQFVSELKPALWALGAQIQEGDLIVSLGAGNVHEVTRQLALDLQQRDLFLEVMEEECCIQLYEPLSKHTTLRVGGPAQFWIEPESEAALIRLVRYCSEVEIPLFVMGRGSNLLVRDGGLAGVVVHLGRGEWAQCCIQQDEIHAHVGVRFKQIAALAKQHGIAGLEWMDGIPGNLGGAVRMNAGAMGSETFDHIVAVHCCDRKGNRVTCVPQDLSIHYRHVPFFEHHIALSAVLKGAKREQDILHKQIQTVNQAMHQNGCVAEEIQRKLQTYQAQRKGTQPAQASAGCVFKNLPGRSAGKIVDELGLKNFCVGKARVSDVHANFIVNDGGATAQDVLELIDHIQKMAFERLGIQMQTELQIVGQDA